MGARTYWRAPIPPLGYSDGATASTAGTLVDISPAPPVQVPPVWELGSRLHVKAFGWYTCSSANTVTLGIYLSPVNTVIVSGGLIASVTTPALSASASQWPWWLEFEAEVRALTTATATANTASLECMGMFMYGSSLTAMNSPQVFPATYAARTVAFTSSLPQNLEIGATTVAATTSIACNHLDVALSG